MNDRNVLAARRRLKQKASDRTAILEKLNHLYTSDQAHLTLTSAEFRTILLHTDGVIIRKGCLCDLRGKHLGVGVYRVTAVERYKAKEPEP